jgi:FixJ family two-component response regulator
MLGHGRPENMEKGNAMEEDHDTSSCMPLHFVETDIQMRAELVKVGRSVGRHCELYSDYSELSVHPPRAGIIFVRDCSQNGGVDFALERLMSLGISLPVVAMDVEPSPCRVVEAMKAGALDFLSLPLCPERLVSCLTRIGREASQVSQWRQRVIHAQRRLAALSAREREVLDALTAGNSNKDIARQLHISPRTVEIHRANMMNKLGARHAAEAIRMKMESMMGRLTIAA